MFNIAAKIKFIRENKITKYSFIVFVGSFIAGIGGYLYNVLMGRMLGPAEYGIFASLVSLLYIISVPAGTLSRVVSRSIAELHAHEKFEEARYFIDKINWLFLKIGLALFVLFLLISPALAGFLRLESALPVIILGTVFFGSFIGAITGAALNGLQRFYHLSANAILGSVLKIIFGALFVWLGWGASGAVGALTASGIFAIIHAYFSFGLPEKSREIKIDWKRMIAYARPVFWATLAITALYNIDVVMVKHYLDPETAGYYGILSLLGKIVLFITGAIPTVLFPIVAGRQSRNEEHFHLLKYSFLLVLAVSLAITAFYFLAPDFIVSLLFGASYLPIAPFLGYFGIVMTLFSLINVLATYNLSLNSMKFVPILLAGVALEIGLIYFFHQNILQVTQCMMAAMFLTFAGLAVFQYRQPR
ncbi:oligosaccharide flippase family protein [Patescibacteria group bacterium]|nr:oligosaccharide flippase family protein [Patescibacteria group bacterium]MBU4579390.1 oligosaccharide flippase family protein [Patescibacteria group bacterium]